MSKKKYTKHWSKNTKGKSACEVDGKMLDKNGGQNIECGEVDWIQLAQNRAQRGILRTC